MRGGKASIRPETYFNRRSEWYWTLREHFEHGEIDIDPDDAELAKQLGTVHESVLTSGARRRNVRAAARVTPSGAVRSAGNCRWSVVH
jgi:hypothetical protein